MNSFPSARQRRFRSPLSLLLLAALLLGLARGGVADVPPRLHFQGRVTVGGVPFHGAGQFKFALVRPVRDGRTATAQALLTLDGQGQLGGVDVTDGGAGYATPPAVTVSDPTGSGAQLQAAVADGRVVAITVLAAGSGYSNPVLSVAPPAPATLWSHDGTSAGGAPPVSAVPLEVTRGLYAVQLGDPALPAMTQPVSAAVLAGGNAALRVWFDDGTHGFQQLTPDQPLASVGFALVADTARVAERLSGDVSFAGPVGIGTASPTAELEVNGAVKATRFEGDGGGLQNVPGTLATTTTVRAWGNYFVGQTAVPAGLTGVTAIAAGGHYTVALKTDGTVVAWGMYADFSQAPVPEGLNGVTAIAAGGLHTVALKADGTVAAWGNSNEGQTTVPEGLSGVTAIAAGYSHTVALKTDGTVVAWGANGAGQANVPPGLTGVTAIAAGGHHTVALKTDGTVVAWGLADLATVPAGLTGVTAIAAGDNHTVALKADGTVVAWGANGAGQTNVPAGLTGVTAIAAGGHYTVALKTDGTVVAWGMYADFGQATVPEGLNGVTAIAAGHAHAVALTQTSSLAGELAVQGAIKATRFVGDGGGLTFHGELRVDDVPVLRLPGGDNRLLAGAGGAALTGGGNTAVGAGALANTTSGGGNTVLGLGALIYNAAGSDNVAVGREALLQSTGHDNIGLGSVAGWRLQTGDHNILIGHPGEESESGTIRIGTPGKHTATHLAGTVKAQRFEGDGSGLTGVAPDGLRFEQQYYRQDYLDQQSDPPVRERSFCCGFQTFKAGLTGSLSRIQAKMDAKSVPIFIPPTVVARLYRGSGLSGELMATSTPLRFYQRGDAWKEFRFTPAPSVAAGEDLTVSFEETGGPILLFTSDYDTYRDGSFFISAGQDTAADLQFRTFVEDPVPASRFTFAPEGSLGGLTIEQVFVESVDREQWDEAIYGYSYELGPWRQTFTVGKDGRFSNIEVKMISHSLTAIYLPTSVTARVYRGANASGDVIASKTVRMLVGKPNGSIAFRFASPPVVAKGDVLTVAFETIEGSVIAPVTQSPPGQLFFKSYIIERGHRFKFDGEVGAQAFVTTSDRNAKANFQPVDPQAVLAKVAALPITQWNFKGGPSERHLGPMAQDFRAAFGLGTDDRHIATVDADGVALAAIQGLHQKLTDKDSEIARLRAELRRFQERLQRLEQALRSAP